MKKLIATGILTLAVASSLPAEAHWRNGCCYRGYSGWVAPALIGGVIGYELSRPYYYAPPPVVLVQPPVVVQQPIPVDPPGYHWQQMTDPQTGQSKMALIPN